jgi:RimJ/RimL family protein N-acetyltransferase
MIITQKHFHKIIIEGKEVGYIQLLSYGSADPEAVLYYNILYPQIEYDLDKKHWNKGIMTRELGLYIDTIKNDFKAITAIVKEDNLASIRVLIKNSFIQIPFGKAGYKIYLRKL